MTLRLLLFKIKERVWREIVKGTSDTKLYLYIYSSYWHYLFHKKQVYIPTEDMFYFARPNFFAGIGHQLANWISGYWWAKQLELNFVHYPFSTKKWDDFLGFGFDELKVTDLLKSGYILKRIPTFDENDQKSIELIKGIMASYQGKKIIFYPPQDHGYKDQFGVMEQIKQKFNNAPSRKTESLIFDKSNFNIAVHVRRTVVIDGKVIIENQASQSLRWLANDYYEKVLKQVLENIVVTKPIDIYLFSTGKPEEFAEFSKYGNIKFCSDLDEYTSFLHLVRADLLITSKSSFSYKPALMNDGIKICPRNFWHSYPDTKDWILVENDGSFDVSKFKQIKWKV
jgi:hypothetical protein